MRAPKRTRIKICGITRVEDAVAAAFGGADAIGMICYPKSPRFVARTVAREIRRALPPFVSCVAVFVNPSAAEVQDVIDEVLPTHLQFHGDEPADFCGQFGLPAIKAFRVRPGADLLKSTASFPDAAAWLLDAFVDGYGGAGKSFDWSLVPEVLDRPMILSGGLTPINVGEAVRRVRPWAVDVASGVEASKGIKDHGMMERFIQEVRRADS